MDRALEILELEDARPFKDDETPALVRISRFADRNVQAT